MIKNKLRIFLFIIPLTIAFSVTLITNSLHFESNVGGFHEINTDLKLSGLEINITSPDNITYYGSMNGYYPATYGFENDEEGNIPDGWGDLSGDGCTSAIINSLDNHEKVLDLWDISSINKSRSIRLFTDIQVEGIFEFWHQTNDASKIMDIRTYNEAENRGGPYIGINNYQYRYWDGSSWHDVFAMNSDEWYHHRVEFDCTSHTYNWYINGILQDGGSLSYPNNDCDDIKQLLFTTSDSAINYHQYIDAIGFSWDPNYHIGDNLNEGLLLSYDTGFTPDWQGYSLDGQANNTILGNTTIPFPPNDDVHSIQVFGNNSLGTMYQSDIRYFTTKFFNILTPENKTYTEPMSGFYPATYGFENDEEGNIPEGWEDRSGDGCTSTVINSLDNHEKVLDLWDISSINKSRIKKTFSDVQIEGIFEFWHQTNDASKIMDIRTYNEAENRGGPYIGINNYQYRYWDGSSWHDVFVMNSDEWYHHRVEFNCTSHTYDWYINGILQDGGNLSYPNSDCDDIKQLLFTTSDSAINYHQYFDAIGFSWNPNYNIGDNLNEGLLLSYDTGFTSDWQGYSLDGQANKTIMGNTTIPFPPNDDVHSIQVFGNNSLGTMYQSDIRYFIIDTTAPTSIISFTPCNGTNEVNKSTTFTISANDGGGSGVSGIRYKINDSSWDDYNSPFNLSSYDYGYYMIYYYSIDFAGHIEPENALLVKLVEISDGHDGSDGPDDSTISGYFVPLLIASVSFVILITIKKRVKLKH